MASNMSDTDTKNMEKRSAGRNCCQRFKDAISFVPQDATPPDWGVLWLILISLFTSAFTLTFLFPFLPEMILTFGYQEEEKGTYVGLVASSVFAGRIVGSFFWGWLSDLKGRRMVLLITIFFNGLFSFLFGFADSLPLAMAIRFLAGVANGTVGVAKTVLYDVSDNTNQAFSMSVISIAWGSGLILGPTVGGYLALPAAKYPNLFSAQGFFADFPFILPSLCCLIVCGIVLVIVFFKFQEPKPVLNEAFEQKVAVENDSAFGSVDKDPKTAGNSHAFHPLASHPLLDKLPSESTSVRSRSVKAHMSMETLHCESELSHYYAQLHSRSHQNMFLTGDKVVSKSMHNLSPVTVSLVSKKEELVPIARKRSYSHGHQGGEAEALNGLNANPKVNCKLADGFVVNEVSAGDLERKPSTPSTGEAGGKLNHIHHIQTSSGGDVAVKVNLAESSETEDSCEKNGSKLRSCWQSLRHSSLVQLLSISGLRHSVALYTVMSFAIIGYEDVLTIFASTSVEYDGLGFSTDEIGIALGAVSIPLMFIQIKIYPILVAKFGIKKSYLINIFFLFIPVQLLPMVHMLTYKKVWLWVCLVMLTLPMRVAANSCFTGSSLLINNSVTSKMAGKANGVGMTFTAIARTLAPTIGGAMFAWSLKMSKTVGAPLDVNLTFAFFGIVLFVSALQCVFLPGHLDHQNK